MDINSDFLLKHISIKWINGFLYYHFFMNQDVLIRCMLENIFIIVLKISIISKTDYSLLFVCENNKLLTNC